MAAKGPGKGQGKDKGAARGPPPAGKKEKEKVFEQPWRKTAATSGLAAQSDKCSVWIMLIGGAGAQQPDGSLGPTEFNEKTASYLRAEKVKRFREDSAVFCTEVYLECFRMYTESDLFKRERVREVVTKVGDGRGVATEKTFEVSAKTVEEAVGQVSSLSVLGDATILEAHAYVAANCAESSGEVEAARAWARENCEVETNKAGSKKTQVSSEARDRAEKLMRQKSFEQRERLKECLAHWRSLQPASITDVAWSTCERTFHMGGGTGGCVLAELSGGQAICIRPAMMHAVSELFAERMCRALDVPVAPSRFVFWTSEEFFAMNEHVVKAPAMMEGQEASVRAVLTGTGMEAEGAAGPEFLAVCQFVQGHGLMGVEAHEALKGEHASKIYAALGRICAADALMNNLDRIPLPLWGNPGNLSNVMVKGGDVVAIDQQVNIVLEGPGREQYQAKLKSLIADVQAGAKSKTAKVVREALEENAATTPSDQSMELMLDELYKGFKECAKRWRSGELERSIAEAEKDAMAIFDLAQTDLGQTRIEAMGGFLRSAAEGIAASINASEI